MCPSSPDDEPGVESISKPAGRGWTCHRVANQVDTERHPLELDRARTHPDRHEHPVLRTSTSSVRSLRSSFTSMTPAVWFQNTLKSRSSLRSTEDGWMPSSSSRSITTRPSARASLILRSDRVTKRRLTDDACRSRHGVSSPATPPHRRGSPDGVDVRAPRGGRRCAVAVLEPVTPPASRKSSTIESIMSLGTAAACDGSRDRMATVRYPLPVHGLVQRRNVGFPS